jgi:hypothetical protein
MESDDSLVHASRSGLAEATPQGRRSVCSTDSNLGFTPLGALVRAGVCGGECGGAFAALAVRRGVCGGQRAGGGGAGGGRARRACGM